MKFEAMRYTMSKPPRPARRKPLHSRPAQYDDRVPCGQD